MRFYTYSKVIDYPWVMRNIYQKPLPTFNHEIVDCSINDLLKPPYQHPEKKLKTWKQLKTIGWKVVPDCPDIDKEFKVKSGVDNVEYSKQLLLDLYDFKNPHHLPVIQGYYQDPNSFAEYGQWFLKNFGMPDKIGIGTICKASNKQAIAETFSLARKMFPDAWIHAFGLRMYHFEVVYPYMNSWDSMSWTFPRGPGKPSAKNKLMRTKYFADYIVRIDEKKIKRNQKLNLLMR